MYAAMDSLCGEDDFWDTDLTWYNNTWPQLKDCFENTVLTWIPCGYLLLVSPFYVPYLMTSSSSRGSPFTRLFILKQVFAIVMIGLLVLEMLKSALHTSYFSSEIMSYVTWIVIMIFHILLVNLERTRGIRRFPVLFVFWILGLATLFIQLYSSIQREIYDSNPFHFIVLSARIMSCCSLSVLHCFFSHGQYAEKEDSSPFITASLPSILYLLWMDPLIIKGFKKPLQDEDLYSLPPQNETYKVMTKFSKHWDKELNRCKSRRRKSKKKKPVQDIKLYEMPLQNQLNEVKIENGKSTSMDDYLPVPMASFTKALWKNFWSEAVKAQAGQLGKFVDEVTSPLILGFFIDYISNQELTWHGYIYTIAILLLRSFSTVTTFPSAFEISLMAVRVQSTVMGSVFRKALTISSEARKESTTGEIINLMSVDATNLRILSDYCFWMWLCILYFFVGVGFTYSIVGFAILPGLGFILLILVMNSFVLYKMSVYQADIMKVKDERVKIMNEILNGIKVIKLYGWESMFINKVFEVREKELWILLKISILEAIFNFAWRGALFWMSYFIIVTFVMTDKDHYLDANTAFVTLSYIGLIRLAVNIIPIIAQDGIKARTSLKRLNKFMNAQDISFANLARDTTDSLSVRIENADFAWENKGSVTLTGINIEIQPGKLIAVVGTVGSGKSSLLSAMLGEMHQIKGYTNLNSSVAYVPQQAWIQNATIKDNILFGVPMRNKSYLDVIKNCCLPPDLKMMAAGDKTEIGEKGINLSGGQKQRISLARAVYSQADIYLLDDPLSAVDSHVGRHIFDNVIGPRGCLQGKTRILVTHGIQWLPEVDQIIVMTNGEITETGSFEELLAQNGDFSRFLTQYFIQKGELDEGELEEEKIDSMSKDVVVKKDILQRLVSVTSESDTDEIKEVPETQRMLSVDFFDENEPSLWGSNRLSHSSLHLISRDLGGFTSVDDSMGKKDACRLTTDEEAVGGRVALTVYLYLLKGMGWSYSVIIAFFIIGYHVTYNLANFWIASWNDDHKLSNFTEFPANSTDRLDRNTEYLISYTVIGFIQTVCVLIYSFVFYIRHVEASRKLHAKLLESIMKAPMSFFDTTPMGRILNRFSQDLEIIDNDIFFLLGDVIEHGLKIFGIVITISFMLPWFLIIIVPIVFLVFGVQRLFVVNSCQARRLASNKRSPIFAHFSETLSGASVIRAYRTEDQFINNSNSKIDECQKAVCVARACTRWMLCRLDMITYIVIGSVCIFAVVMRDELTPGIIGLIVSYAFTISIELCLTVDTLGMLETNSVSVERIREYSNIKSEASWTMEGDSHPMKSNSTWPSQGGIQFDNYSTRYREGLDLVLNNIICNINGGEKIGIVGRTGAGKSSMVLSLFRLIEAVSGRILIDGVDISQIGLHTLRHNITILPQDPVLFAGSIRMNLDPHEEKTDSEIWTALEHSHLKSFILGLDAKLDHDVGESGENLSMGQRQLLCLARTLLRKTKILVLDEATAAVDMDTDDLIQKTIRTEFSECTIMTIAHRLNTVMDYDRIMVLDRGEVIEFDSPASLLADSTSSFYSMARDAGLVGKDT